MDATCKADFIWSFAEDFMAHRLPAEYKTFNILAVDWYDSGSAKGSDPNDTLPDWNALYEFVNVGDAQNSAANAIAAAEVLAHRLSTVVGAANLHPENMMLIGHSNGAGFMASMSLKFLEERSRNVAELVALDAPTFTRAWGEVVSCFPWNWNVRLFGLA